jgi:hypothetical protein
LISYGREAKEEAVAAGTLWDGRKFEYSSNTSNSTLRPHLEKFHTALYKQLALERGWKMQLPSLTSQARSTGSIIDSASEDAPDKFTEKLFYEYLVKFIVADDQVCSYAIY